MLARMLIVVVVMVGGTIAGPRRSVAGEGRSAIGQGTSSQAPSNPRQLRAAQWLGEPREGTGAAMGSRVRFEWDQVPGARAYLLRGRWTGEPSWAVRSVEHRVTPENATCWGRRRVEFDVTLPQGAHSWRVVALFTPNDRGDFENATRLSFEVR